MISSMRREWGRLTTQEVQAIADKTPVEQYTRGKLGGGDYMPPFLDDLVGRRFSLKCDSGLQLDYSFKAVHEAAWSENGQEAHTDYVDVVQAPGAESIYFINHYCQGSCPPRAHMLVVDLSTGLATAVVATVGTPMAARDVDRVIHFGILDGYEDAGARHDYTNDMIGTAIKWTYFEQSFSVKHIYPMPTFYAVSGLHGKDSSWMAANPARYIKVADGIYIFTFVEERQSGSQGFFVINLKLLHDVGSFFGVQADGLECYMVGAKGEFKTMHTFFDIKTGKLQE